jgi:hypothetical protein
MTKATQVPLSEIVLDPRLQMRETMDFTVIDEYAESLADLPPSKIVKGPQGEMWLTSGWHRYHAHARKKQKEMPCIVRDGTFLDALAEAAGENHGHGIRRTNEDKRRAVAALLSEDLWKNKSDRMIAEACHVTHPFVAKIRESIPTGNVSSQGNSSDSPPTPAAPPTRTGADGKERPTSQPAKPEANAPPLCDRCKKEGVKAGCTMCRELRFKPPQAPKPEPAETDESPVDAFQNPLPKKCRKHYLDPWITETIDFLAVTEEKLRMQQIIKGMDKRKEHYPFMKPKDVIDGIGFAMNYLEQVLEHLKEFRPAGVCPKCEGKGCASCKMCGMVPRTLYTEMKK